MSVHVRLALLLLAVLAARSAAGQAYVPRAFGAADGVGHVRALASAADGTLWLGTAGGLVRYDGVRFEAVPLPGGARSLVDDVAVEADGVVWAVAGEQLVRWSPSRAVAVPVPAALAEAFRTALPGHLRVRTLGRGRVALVAFDAGLWLREADGRWRLVLGSTPEEPVRDLARAADGTAWVLTRRRLGRLTFGADAAPRLTWTDAEIRGGLHVCPHPEGAWVASGLGVFLVRGGVTTAVLDEPHRGWYSAPASAADGTLTVSLETPSDGVRLFVVGPDGTPRHRIGTKDGLRNATFDAVAPDGAGGFWVGSKHGLDHFDVPGRLRVVALGDAGVSELARGDGVVWASTWRGVYRVRGLVAEAMRPGAGGATMWLRPTPSAGATWLEFATHPAWYRVFHASAAGTARMLPESGRLVRAVLPDGRRLEHRFQPPHLDPAVVLVHPGGREVVLASSTDLRVAVVGPPPRRRVWLVLNGRLETLEGDALGSESAATPPSVRAILDRFAPLDLTAFDADADGRLWAASRRGLLRLEDTGGDRWETRMLGPADGLLSAHVNDVHTAGRRLWVGTARGVQGFAIGGAGELRPIRLPGLNERLPTAFAEHVVEDHEGVLWVAVSATRALYRYDPHLAAPEPVPPVRLSAVAVNGVSRAPRLGLRFRADTSRVALALAPRAAREGDGLTFRYRLLGLSTAWVDAGPDATLRFDYLPPGRYVLETHAIRAGRAGPDLRVPLVLGPPFWQAVWFRALLLLLVTAVVAGGVWRHGQRATRRQAELEGLVRERTAALAAEKATTEAQARELAARADRLGELDEAKSRFFANVSHELRTPLTLMLGPVRDGLAGRYGPIPAPLAAQLPAMRRSGERLLRLIGQLLDLARLDAGRLRLHKRPTDLAALARRVVLAFRSEAEREGLALSYHADPPVVPTLLDRDRVEEVLTNLVVNAFKFTPSGGRILVDVAVHGADAELSVRDSGEGIAPDLLPHVFERFRQGDDAPTRHHGGAGIGLALVREVVELHGGTVVVESAPGFGTTFSVRLPLAETSPLPDEVPASHPEDAEDFALASRTAPPADAPVVLVVEDDADLRAYVASMLAPHYRVVEAADGEAGLAAAGEATPDLVVADVMMPRLDGLDLCRALKADPALGHVPVVLLTARADEASRLDGLGVGADDYLTKPFSADELLLRCENLIEVRRRLRARFSGEVVVRPAEVVVPSAEAAWLAEVQAVVVARLADATLSVDWLAAELAMSPRSPQRRLKAASGLGPAALVRALRLERAADLLAQGAGPVADVARAVGFRDPEYFGRAFRMAFGVAPSAFAELVRTRDVSTEGGLAEKSG